MLRYLKVTNLAIIDEAELELGPGFICLTGESGAGKSVLIDALLLLAGQRASSDMVRGGCDKAIVEAEFELNQVDASHDLIEEAQLLLRREITAEGRSRAFVNGVMVPNGVLQTYADLAFEIHGQHGQQRLLKNKFHGLIFEDQTGLKPKVASFQNQLEELRQRFRIYWELKDGEAQRLKEIDFIELQIKEIEEVKPNKADADLELRLKRSRNGETIRAARAELAELLGARLLPNLTRAEKLLRTLIEFSPELVAYGEEMTSLAATLADLHTEVGYGDDYFDPRTLQKLEARQSALYKLYMKYGRNLEEVLEEAGRLKQRLIELKGASSGLSGHWQDLEKCYAQLYASRERLIAAREKAIAPFTRDIKKNLRELALPGAEFQVHHNWPPWPKELTGERELHLSSAELHFLFSSNPGEPVRSLARVASGGELSRVLLALIGAFKRPSERLLVFDEVDSGLGGETAHAVGAKLAELGKKHQALCVTHFAQVARCADQQIKLEKKVKAGRTTTSLVRCDYEQRIQELARLMGGDAGSESLQAHARELIGKT